MNKNVFVRLKPEQYKIFEAIKKFLGLSNDAEVIRYLITDFYKTKLEKESAVQ